MTALMQSAPEQTMRPLRGTRGRALPDTLVVGGVAFLLSVAFSWLPSLWYDEAATVVSSTRSWPQLWEMISNVDAVHGLYYAGMHLWFDLVGYSPLTLRLPSAITTGVTAALLVVLVRSFAPRRTALLAGLLFAVLPRVTWAGTEGRSFAVTTMFAVLLTLVFLAAGRQTDAWSRARWWLLYSALAALFTMFFLYLAFLVAAHGVSALWTWAAARRSRSGADTRLALLGWLAASVGAALALLPFVRIVTGQVGQISWIDPISVDTLRRVFVTQWFYLNPLFALVGWVLIVLGAVHLARGRAPATPGQAPSLLVLVLPWLVVPTFLLVIASLGISPLYSPRYLSFGAPAVAILMAVGIDGLRTRRRLVVALALCVVLAVPGYLGQRLPEAKQESSWSEVADLVAAQRAVEPAGTTGAIIYGPVRQHATATTRVIAYAYPEAFAGLVDVKLRTPAARTGELWETRFSLDSVTERFTDVDTVWLVTSNKQDWRPSVTEKVDALGFTLQQESNLTGVNVLRYSR